MTLRNRLALAFLAVVLAPLVAVAVLVQSVVPSAAREQRGERLQAEAAAVAQALNALCDRVSALARATALDAAARTPALAATSAVREGGADFAVVRDGQAVQLAAAGVPTTSTSVRGCASGDATRAAVTAQAQVVRPGAQPVTRVAVVGFVVSSQLLTRLRPADDVDVVVSLPGGAAATTNAALARDSARLGRAAATSSVLHEGKLLLASGRLRSELPWTLVVSTEDPGGGQLPWLLLAAVALAAGAAWLLGQRLAVAATRPLVEVAAAATQIADGDFGARVPVGGGDEVGAVAAAFNAMTERLQVSFGELQASRDQLRRDLARLGETLTSTHDLTRILGVILETTMGAARARAGAVFLTTPGREELYLKVGRGLEGRGITSTSRIPFGRGTIGGVAATGEAAWGRTHSADEGMTASHLELDPSEPKADELIAVPLRAGGRVIGVLSLYDRSSGDFSSADVEAIWTFAGQASVAVDNVLLHQEAQRLSVTDGMTGLSNYRAFQRQLAREVERAQRFGRPLGLLLLDLDFFKAVNDTHGHQVGDAVLIELAQRVQAEVRDVDLVARYGGEELVVVLPETDATGAGLLAERICAVVRAMPFDADGVQLTVTVSVGAAALPEHATTAADLLRAADEAMYAAKAAGRDTWRPAQAQPAP